MKKNQYRNTQHSPTVKAVDDFVIVRNQGARLQNGQDGEVMRSYQYQGGRGTEKKPLSPYFGKKISKADRHG